MNISENVTRICERIENTAIKAGRAPSSVKLVAVTKTVDAEAAKAVMDAGVCALGENRVQSFLEKYEVLGSVPQWHIIGHLQTNKVKYITGKVSLIHSVDSVHLAQEISRKAERIGTVQDILLQFNISGEESKSGATPESAQAFIEEVAPLVGVRIKGLMTMAPLGADETETRKVFAGLRMLRDDLEKRYPDLSLSELSMGMSGDFESAICEGATIVRVGSALFR